MVLHKDDVGGVEGGVDVVIALETGTVVAELLVVVEGTAAVGLVAEAELAPVVAVVANGISLVLAA
jgi:hypothetical protein